MYIVVIGGGTVGFHLTRALLNAGHECFVVEWEKSKVENLTETYGAIALKGDCCEPSTLAAAGVSRADLIIATTGNDEDNLAACQVASHVFKVGRTIAVVNNPENETLFNLLGIDLTVDGTQVILAGIEEELPEAPIHVLPLRASHEVVSIEIPADSAVVSRYVEEVDLPSGTKIVALISRDGQLKPLETGVTIEAFDEVVALATSETAEALREALGSEE
jgi:trk system potassium uptake protein TrkA